MPIEPYEIVTIHPDGTTERRLATKEEIAQRESDLAQFEAERIAHDQMVADIEAKRISARDKLSALGLDDAEIDAIIGIR